MSEFFEKIAAENEGLADIFMKVADEDVVSKMTQEEQLDELLNDMEAAGIDLEDPAVLEELKEASDEDIYAYNLDKALDIMSQDFLNNVEKLAAGEPGFETAAAAKAVEQFFDINGAALFGTSFGPGNNQFGTTLSPAVDKNVFGGFGKQIMTTNIQPNAVNASGKISGLINGTNMNIIKSASDDEILDFFYTKLAEAAEFEGQTVDEFVHDLGMEALRDEVKQANEGKVGNFIKDASKKSKSIFKKKKEDEEEEKQASDIAFGYVEQVANETGKSPEDLVLEYGLEKAAEYLDELLEKDAEIPKEAEGEKAGLLKRLGDASKAGLDKAKAGAKATIGTNVGRAATGTAVGAGLGAYLGSKKGKDKGEKKKNAIKGALIGGGSGLAAGYAANTSIGAYNFGKMQKSMDPKHKGVGLLGALKGEFKGQGSAIAGAAKKVKDAPKSAIDSIKKKLEERKAKKAEGQKKEGSDSFENTLYELAQQKLYNNEQ